MGKQRNRATRSVAEAAGIRALRLELLLREELNSLLDGELGDPRLDGVRVNRVELSRDGSRARIWYSTTTSDAPSVNLSKLAFAHAAAFFRARLCDALPLKRTPELSFRYDPAVTMD